MYSYSIILKKKNKICTLSGKLSTISVYPWPATVLCPSCCVSYEGTCDVRKNFLPAPSLFHCAPAVMLMPFVCVGSMGVVIIIAFFRESHSEFLHFYLQYKTGRGVLLWGVHRGEVDPPWGRESRGEDRCALWTFCGCHLRQPGGPAASLELCCLAEIQRCCLQSTKHWQFQRLRIPPKPLASQGFLNFDAETLFGCFLKSKRLTVLFLFPCTWLRAFCERKI